MLSLLFLILLGAVSAKHDNHGHDEHLDFVTWLKEVKAGYDFQHLSPDDQLMYAELVMAAEEGPTQLTDFIHRIGGLATVLTLADELSSDDRTYFEEYLSTHLVMNPKQQTKRSDGLFSTMYDLHFITKLTEDFSYELEHLFVTMMKAAEHDNLTQFVETTGFGPILHMFSELDGHDGEVLNQLVIKQLNKEKAMQS